MLLSRRNCIRICARSQHPYSHSIKHFDFYGDRIYYSLCNFNSKRHGYGFQYTDLKSYTDHHTYAFYPSNMDLHCVTDSHFYADLYTFTNFHAYTDVHTYANQYA